MARERLSNEDYAKQQREEQRALLERAVENLATQEGWKNYILHRAKLKRRSFTNTILIALQDPEGTHHEGHKTWIKQFDRKVTQQHWDDIEAKTARPVLILAPVMVDKKDSNGNVITGSNGKPEKIPAFFRSVKIYDIRHTEGKEVPPVPEPEPITGHSHMEYTLRCEAYARFLGWPVSKDSLESETDYIFDHNEYVLRINYNLEINGRVRAMIQALAYKVQDDNVDLSVYTIQEQRIITQSVAFMVCASVGLDTTGLIVPYITQWASDDFKSRMETLKNMAGTIDILAEKLEEAIS